MKFSKLIPALLFLSCVTAQAQTLDAVDRGWLRDNPMNGNVESIATVQNYLAGRGLIASTPTGTIRGEYRNFFVFDLGAFAGKTFSSAELSLYNPQYGDPGTTTSNPNMLGGFYQGGVNAFPYETYQLQHVTTAPSAFINATAGRGGYDDLGDGATLGSYNASLSDNGSFIRISLNGSGLSALNAAAGGLFVIGGRVTTLAGDTGSQTIFGFTNDNNMASTQLRLVTAVPEPETYAMLLGGLTVLGLRLRRRKTSA
ncbi:MAG TPA: PEP-CTERM sorting domain-containing protein [Azospira sp.]|nr:PEP-CTERM sorting domain-containing protein [Azospira sp.]